MKIKYPTTATEEAAAILCNLPLRHEEDIDEKVKGTPWEYFLIGRKLLVTLDLDQRKVVGWPGGRAEICLKVVDEGIYQLCRADGTEIACRDDDYVPSCVPGEYGDYFECTVSEDGTVEGWAPRHDQIVAAFWAVED